VDDHQVGSPRLRASGTSRSPTRKARTAARRGAFSAPGFVAAETADAVRASVERFSESASELLPPEVPLRVLYVGGWGRSGSTLVDRLLGQVPGCFSVGEMRDVWLRGVVENRRCGCGEPFDRCPFWTKVGDVAFGGWDRSHAVELHRLRMRYDRPWMAPVLGARAVRSRGLDRYVDVTARLYRAIRDVSGAGVIVDSTKIPSYALVLSRIPGIDLRFLHLVRDSRGVVHSWNKSVVRPDATTRPDRMIRYGTASASGRYVLYNATAEALRASRVPYAFERYEDVVRDPAARLRRILDFAGMPDADLGFIRGATATLAPNHSVDGNPMRFTQGALEIRADEEWRTRLDERDRRLVSTITGPLLRRYGYRG
jgi:hypothetical protein